MKDEGTFVIVNDEDEYFAWLTCSVDEFDRICNQGAAWPKDWKSAHVFRTRKGAEKMLETVRWRSFLKKAAVVP